MAGQRRLRFQTPMMRRRRRRLNLRANVKGTWIPMIGFEPGNIWSHGSKTTFLHTQHIQGSCIWDAAIAYFLYYLPMFSRLLTCGQTLTADLHEMGFTNQTSIDFSSVVIRGMAAKYKRLGVEWKVMDVRDMSFDDKTFDIAIDKGTMDSMFHGSMWDPPDDVRNNITKYLDEIERILVPGGTFLYLTYRQPHFIRPLLMRDETWSFDVRHLPDKQGGVFEYFAYVMVKHGQKQNGVSSSVSNSEDEES